VEVCLISPTPTYVGDRMPEYSAGTLGNCWLFCHAFTPNHIYPHSQQFLAHPGPTA
jgi:hypothetical protein